MTEDDFNTKKKELLGV
ncbi:hypothetical protein [Metaclostridioides mangenotii]